MNTYLAIILVFATAMSLGLSTVSAQTFQYSRGWTNGKRNGLTASGVYEMNMIDRLLSNPCQLEKLRYILQGKPLNEKLMVPCDLLTIAPSDAEAENAGLRLKRSPLTYENRNSENHYGSV